jgi:hypothetical protein
MIFALRDAAIAAGHREPRRREAFFRKIRSEIGQACEDGRLTCRRVLSHVLDPVPANYVSQLPASVSHMLRPFVAPANAVVPGGDAPVTAEVRNLFDRMASRRVALISAGQEWVHVTGWAVHVGDPVVRVVARDRETNTVVASTNELVSRPDVRNALGEETPIQSGFRLSIPMRSRTQRPSLHVVTQAAREFSVPYERRLEMDRALVKNPSEEPRSLRYAVDSVQETLVPRSLTDKVKTAIGRSHGPIVLLLTAASVLALLLLALGPGEAGTLLPIAAFVLAIVVMRVLLFAVIDASAWPASQARYLWPAVAVYPAALIILLDGAVRAVRGAWMRGEERWNAWPRRG